MKLIQKGAIWLFLMLLIIGISETRAQGAEFGAQSASLTNKYLTMSKGDKFVYAGYGNYTGFFMYYEATATEIIDGVNCLKVIVVYEGQNPLAEYFEPRCYWFAQDVEGNVWVLQEADLRRLGVLYYGRKDAVLFLPKSPRPGQRIFDVGLSYVEVLETGVTLNKLDTGVGPLIDCLKMEYVADEGRDVDIIYLAPYLFFVRAEWDAISGWNLQKVTRKFQTPSHSCASADQDLKINIACAVHNGIGFSLILEFYSNPSNPLTTYWKLSDYAPVDNCSCPECASIDDSLDIFIPCIEYNGSQFTVRLDRYVNPDDPFGFYWEFGSLQPKE